MVGRGRAQLLFFPTLDNGETGSGPDPRTAARQSDPSEAHGKYRPQAIFASYPLVLQMRKLSPTKLRESRLRAACTPRQPHAPSSSPAQSPRPQSPTNPLPAKGPKAPRRLQALRTQPGRPGQQHPARPAEATPPTEAETWASPPAAAWAWVPGLLPSFSVMLMSPLSHPSA